MGEFILDVGNRIYNELTENIFAFIKSKKL